MKRAITKFGHYNCDDHTSISSVFPQFKLTLSHVSSLLPRVKMTSINWSAPNMWVFTAQLVEHCSANADAIGSSPVEALKIIFRLKFAKALFTVNLLIYITIKSSMRARQFQAILLF